MKTPASKNYKPLLFALVAIILFLLIAIPWKNYVYQKNITDGKNLLAERNYTEAYVKFQKASMLKIQSSEGKNLQKLAKDSAKDILVLKSFLADNHYDDLLKLITDADSKVCRLDADKTLIEKNLADIAIINLKFCANDGPRDYQSWIFLGLANIQQANNSHIFKEYKPEFRQLAADAFTKAYQIDPINKQAIEYSISINKIIGNQSEVDRWQKLLDNLNKISE